MSTTYYSPFFPGSDTTGTKGTTVPVVTTGDISTINAGLGGVQSNISTLQAGGFLDGIAPAIPTNLVLTTALTQDANGNQLVTLTATWTAPTATDLAGYNLDIKQAGGNFITSQIGKNYASYTWTVQANVVYTVQLRAFDNAGNQSGYTAQVSLTSAKDNVAPNPPTSLAGTAAFNSIFLTWTNDSAVDLTGVQVLHNTTNNSNTAALINTVYADPSTAGAFTHTGLATGTSHYYWLKSVDSSSNISGLSTGIGPVITSSVSAADVTPGLNFLPTVTSLPNPSGYTGPSVVFNSTDGKVYRLVSGAWTAAVNTADLSGTLTAGQIAPGSIDITKLASSIVAPRIVTNTNINDGTVTSTRANDLVLNTVDGILYRNPTSGATTGWVSITAAAAQISGQLTSDQIASLVASKLSGVLATSNIPGIDATKIISGTFGDAFISGVSAAKLTSQITTTQITDGSISTAKIAAGAVVANSIAAGTITSSQIAAQTIISGNIAAGTIVGTNIAAGTLTANNIAGGTITGDRIAGNTITATNIAANTITATQIAANTITAGQISAGAIGATQIAAAAITSSKIAIGSFDNLTPTGDFTGGAASVCRNTAANGNTITFPNIPANVPGGWPSATCIVFTRSSASDTSELSAVLGPASFDTDTSLQYGIPCEVNDQFYFSAVTWQSGGAIPVVDFVLRATDGTVAVITSLSSTLSVGQFVLGSLTVKNNSGKRGRAYVRLNAGGTPTATNSAVYYWNAKTVKMGGGELIVDGSITGTDIAAQTITANNILANTITANQIAASTITGDRLVVGTIQSAQIASNAITASKIGVLGANLFPDGQVLDLAWWTSNPTGKGAGIKYNQPANTGPVWTQSIGGDNSTFAGGANGWRLTQNNGGSSARSVVQAPLIGGITGNQYYNFKATVTNFSTDQFLQVSVNWWDGNGTNLNVDAGLIAQAAGITSVMDVQVRAPATAAYVGLYFYNQAGTTTALNMVIGGFTIREAGTGQLLVDGTVSATKLIAQSITADKIAAGSITGDRISSSTSLPSTLTIGTSGYLLGTIASAANVGQVAGANRVPMSEFGNATTTAGWAVYDNQANSYQNIVTFTYANQTYIDAYFVATASNQLGSLGNSILFPVTGGETLSFSAGVGDTGGGGSSQQVQVVFYDTNGNEVGPRLYSAQIAPQQPWYKLGGIGTVPGTAVKGLLIVYVWCKGGSGQSYRVQISHPMVCGASPGQAVLTPYSPGPDGSQPASVINANTTQILPGKILIGGATSLSNWIYGGDNTSINGGSIAANTVTSNKLTVGNRNIQLINIVFSNDGVNTISWTNGYVEYYDESYNRQVTYVNGGSGSRVSQGGNVTGIAYVWFDRINSTANQVLYGGEQSVSAIMTNQNNVVLASYFGGNSMNSNYGQTIIDGSGIRANSITATQITALSITADRIVDHSITQTVTAHYSGPLQGTGTPSGAGGTSGGGGGGGTVACVWIESILPNGKRAGDSQVGDNLLLLNREDDNGYHYESLEAVRTDFSQCVLIQTETGISLVVSVTTPITTYDGNTVNVIDALGLDVPVLDDGIFRWEKLTSVEPAGFRHVVLISAGDGTYAAGQYDNNRFIFTHNTTVKP